MNDDLRKAIQRQKLIEMHDAGVIDTDTLLRSLRAAGIDVDFDVDVLEDEFGFGGDWWKEGPPPTDTTTV
jgi:hypothetical protein